MAGHARASAPRKPDLALVRSAFPRGTRRRAGRDRRDLPDALLTFTDGFTIAFRQRIGSFALTNRLPMISEVREFADAGGVATYGVNRADLWRRSASYVDKIMRGAKPGDLPVEQPTRFEMVINLNHAKALGLEVSPTLLATADEVIE